MPPRSPPAAAITGSSSPSGAVGDYPVLPSSNSRLSYSSSRSIDTAIIAVDIPRMKGVNLGQLSDYVAMVAWPKSTWIRKSTMRLRCCDYSAKQEALRPRE